MDENKFYSKKPLYLLILVLFISAAVYYFLSNWKKQTVQTDKVVKLPPPAAETTIDKADKGVMTLSPSAPSVAVGDTVVVTVSVAAVEPIVAYDAAITYDQSLLTYVSAASLLPNFILVPQSQPGKVNITGSKQIGGDNGQFVASTPVAAITFRAAASGRSAVNLDFTKGLTADSNLMNTKSQDVLDSVSGTTITVK